MALNLVEVPKVASISKVDFLENYFTKQKPVVIKKLISNWPAYHLWNLDYIDSVAGHKTVPIFDGRPISSEFKVNQPHKFMKMHAYIDLLRRQEPTHYRIFLYNLLKEVPVLKNDFDYPDLGLKFLRKLPFLFFGGAGSKVFMHYDIDLSNILHFHFHGQKQCILFPPSQTKYLYKVPHGLVSHSEIDFLNPNFLKWPALAHAKGYIANLQHGETLYMPEGYWHHMTYVTPGFSMSLRAVPRKIRNFVEATYNVFLMRHFDNFMRKYMGDRWMIYKNHRAVQKGSCFTNPTHSLDKKP